MCIRDELTLGMISTLDYKYNGVFALYERIIAKLFTLIYSPNYSAP